MAELSNRIDNVLNEARMLLLGGQVLLGFSYRIFFEPGFERISEPARLAQLSGVSVMTAGLGLLIWPVSYHQIAQRGSLTEKIERFTTKVLDWALLPLALGLGLTLYPVASSLHLPYAVWIGVGSGLLALMIWYGGLLVNRNRKSRWQIQRKPEKQKEQNDASDLPDRIRKVLVECRMALPGAQAFLGFQFAIVFAQGFDALPRSSQLIHFGSLLATTMAIVLLIAPAAYHRLAEAGENTERFLKVASGFLLAALVFLAPGMAGDLLVVIRKITGSGAGDWIAGFLLLAFYVLWFGVSFWSRARHRE